MTLPELTKDSTEITYIPKDKRQKPYTLQIKDLDFEQLEAIVKHQVLNGYIIPSLVTERIAELMPYRSYNER